ncbi:SDR family NAD(P)-dependent oxidoreductase [Dyella flava]|uniref:SDR family oxidoreductase n=1 Tax=Dyella flava TaxID=1920170 RepID=A0ABS2K341_9GAMM|nr:SDR family oxidoreductase [Dyella flava]MBM7125655.1 SDR family oxidoreductase [Dyella flava]GLQ48831.1 dehydrogenase [Dyella flava]
MSQARPLSLITGASAGIGEAFARALAARGHDVVLTARRTERLETLAVDLRKAHRVNATVITNDLADPHAVEQLCRTLDERGLQVDWLINNAGYGVPGRFDQVDWPVHADFIRVLMTAPTELAWRLISGMRERRFGRIVNVASLAGHVPGTAGHTLYAASKAYMIKFSQSLALEGRALNVHACALCPGFTKSEFHDVTGTRDMMNKLPGFMWQTSEQVVQEGIDAVERGDAVYVTGRFNRTVKSLFKLMPDKMAMKVSARQSKRYRAQ